MGIKDALARLDQARDSTRPRFNTAPARARSVVNSTFPGPLDKGQNHRRCRAHTCEPRVFANARLDDCGTGTRRAEPPGIFEKLNHLAVGGPMIKYAGPRK